MFIRFEIPLLKYQNSIHWEKLVWNLKVVILFYFRKANAVRVHFLHTIKRYLSISFCFLKLCCINASRLLLFCVFIDGDFWGVNTYSTLPPPPLVSSEVQVHGNFSLYKHLVCQSVLGITSHPRLPAAFIGYPLPPGAYK